MQDQNKIYTMSECNYIKIDHVPQKNFREIYFLPTTKFYIEIFSARIFLLPTKLKIKMCFEYLLN
jgi:hypothetical protein